MICFSYDGNNCIKNLYIYIYILYTVTENILFNKKLLLTLVRSELRLHTWVIKSEFKTIVSCLTASLQKVLVKPYNT